VFEAAIRIKPIMIEDREKRELVELKNVYINLHPKDNLRIEFAFC